MSIIIKIKTHTNLNVFFDIRFGIIKKIRLFKGK